MNKILISGILILLMAICVMAVDVAPDATDLHSDLVKLIALKDKLITEKIKPLSNIMDLKMYDFKQVMKHKLDEFEQDVLNLNDWQHNPIKNLSKFFEWVKGFLKFVDGLILVNRVEFEEYYTSTKHICFSIGAISGCVIVTIGFLGKELYFRYVAKKPSNAQIALGMQNA